MLDDSIILCFDLISFDDPTGGRHSPSLGHWSIDLDRPVLLGSTSLKAGHGLRFLPGRPTVPGAEVLAAGGCHTVLLGICICIWKGKINRSGTLRARGCFYHL